MSGIIFSVLAGALMSIQGVFNTRLNEKIGLWEATTFVQGTAFVFSILIMFFVGNGDFRKIGDVNKLYLTGGIIGALITYTVIKAIGCLCPTYAIATILVSQLVVAALIDKFSLFGTEPIIFGWSKFLGVIVMILGIVLFKWKG